MYPIGSSFIYDYYFYTTIQTKILDKFQDIFYCSGSKRQLSTTMKYFNFIIEKKYTG